MLQYTPQQFDASDTTTRGTLYPDRCLTDALIDVPTETLTNEPTESLTNALADMTDRQSEPLNSSSTAINFSINTEGQHANTGMLR